MFNNNTRIVGMHSGMDTDAIVRQMMNAESMRLNRLNQQRTLVQWRQEAYRGMADLLRGFQTTFTGTIGQNSSTSLRMPSNFRTLSASAVSSTGGGEPSNAIRARALANAAQGSFEVNVSQVAKGDIFIGRSIPLILTSDDTIHTGQSMFGPLEVGDQFMVRLDGGNEVTITISEDDIMNTLVDPPTRRSFEAVVQNLNTRLRDMFGFTVNSDGTASTEQKVSVGMQSNGHISFLTGSGHSARITGGPAGRDALAKLGFTEGGGTTTFDLGATLAETGFFANSSNSNTVSFEINGRQFRFDRSDSLQHVMDSINNANIGVRMSFDRFRSAFRMESTGTGLSSRINLNDADDFFASVLGIRTGDAVFNSRQLTRTQDSRDKGIVGDMVARHHYGPDSGSLIGTPFMGGNYFNITVNGVTRQITLPDTVTNPSATPPTRNIYELSAEEIRNLINLQLDTHFGAGNVRLNTTLITATHNGGYQYGPDGNRIQQGGFDVVHDPSNPSASPLRQLGSVFHFTTANGHNVQVEDSDNAADSLLAGLGFSTIPADGFDLSINEDTNLYLAGAFRGAQERTQFTLNGQLFRLGAYATDSNGVIVEPPGSRIKTIGELLYAVNTHLAGGVHPDDPAFDPDNPDDTGARLTFVNGQFVMDMTNMEAGARLDIDEHNLGFFTALGMNPNAMIQNSQIQRAQNAMVQVDGSYISRESNTFEVNGVELSISAASVAQGSFTIDVTRDVQPTFDLIMNFVDEYNTLLEELNRAHRTPRPREQGSHFDPLTDDERRELSDREIELWEERARTGMLFRSDVISTIHQQLRSLMFAPVTLADGTRLALHNIGITTSNEGGNIGKLQVDENALRRALEQNPDGVLEMFTQSSPRPGTTVQQRNARMREQGIGERLNDIVRNAIDFGGSIFNRAGIEGTSSQANNSLHREMSRHDDRIDNMRDFLARRENTLLRMFASMEMAMANANNQMNSIMSMMGMF
jgi:flagellar capping protein FliD